MKTSLLAILVLSGALFAQTIDFQITQSTCNNSGDLVAMLQNLPTCLVESFFSFVKCQSQQLINRMRFCHLEQVPADASGG